MKKKEYEDWPPFASTALGVSIVSTRWSAVRVMDGVLYSTARLRLAGYSSPAVEMADCRYLIKLSRTRTLREGRKVLAPSFRCSIVPPGAESMLVGVGSCRTWEEAVTAAAELDVAAVMKRYGEAIYRPSNFKLVRPFQVVYPWDDPEEPNAKYSPFKFVGGWRLEDANSGCVAMQYAATVASMRELANRVDANAFLMEDEDGLWVYHRGNMTRRDPISLDDFHGRLIAGLDDAP